MIQKTLNYIHKRKGKIYKNIDIYKTKIVAALDTDRHNQAHGELTIYIKKHSETLMYTLKLPKIRRSCKHKIK